MIPVEFALISGVVVSCLLMLDRDSARGFALAYLVCWLFLPAKQELNLPGWPGLDKFVAPSLGVLLGTIFFHPQIFDRWKFRVPDLILLLIVQMDFVSTVANDQGWFPAFSRAIQTGLTLVLPIQLARLHIGTPRGLRTFLLFLIGAAIVYTPLAVWEFRMSPQIHTKTYGYFQHSFVQHYRNGFWRPILFFPHALLLGRFFAFTAFLAMLPMRKDLVNILGNRGKYVFLIPMLGLLITQSYGPYLLFGLLSIGYWSYTRSPIPRPLLSAAVFALPIIVFIWVGTVFAGYRLFYGGTDFIGDLNAARAQSLEYRLFALATYADVILERPFFGYGGFGNGRIEDVATDSQAVMNGLTMGLVGSGVYYLWFAMALYTAVRVVHMTENTVLYKRAVSVAILASISISWSAIDKGMDELLLALLGGIMGIHMTAANEMRRRADSRAVSQK